MMPTNGRSDQAPFFDQIQPFAPAPEVARPARNPASGPQEALSADVLPGEVLSPSQTNKFLDCPAKWYFKYMLGLPDPLNSNLAVGIAVDNTLSHYFRIKAADGVEMPEADVLDVLDPAWADQEAVMVLREGEDPEQLHALCQRLVRSYLSELAPKVTPGVIEGEPAVQVRVEGTIAGVKVQGIIDLIKDDGTIVDLKTTKRKLGAVPADHMLQMTTYDLLCPHSRGRAELHYMVKNRSEKSVPKIVPFTREIGPEEVLFAESIYPAVQESMRDGIYLPSRTSRFCSRKYCPFWKTCEKEFGGKINP